mgnify:CR=1 FL=1
MRKKLLSTLLATAMAVTMLAGCGSNGGQQATTPATDNKTETSAEAKTETSAEAKTETSGATGGGKVGVAMPTKDLQRWNQDGSNMQAQLEAAGYDVDLQYASNDIPTQVSQIENMINSGCELLVIASIDGDSLGTVLEQAKEKLSKRMSLFTELTNAAKKKRTYEKTKPFYKWLALFMVIMGAAALGYGVYSFMNHDTFAVYFVLFGMAAIFLFSGANVMPTSTNNRKAIEKRLASAETAVESYVDSLHLGLPVPSCYLHPVTVERMERVIREGRAESVEDAFAAVKDDLRKTNADVSVTQEEFDEIMAIKPVFLVRDYA